jgi:uncharacterized protein
MIIMSKELEYLYNKMVYCQMCQETYTTKKILTKYIRATKHDTDFCSYYTSTKINPLLYYVHVCPGCGYSSSDEFSTFFPPTSFETIQEKVCTNWNGANYCHERTVEQAINTYKLAIYCATLKKERHITLSGLYLRLSWIYRTEKMNVKEETRFLRLALNEYSDSYMNGDFVHTHLTEIKLLYLIGDISRRLGKNEQATRYFSHVIQMQKESIEKGIVEMAKDRWAEMRATKSG